MLTCLAFVFFAMVVFALLLLRDRVVDGRWRRRRKEQEEELLGESYRLRSAAAASAGGAARRRVRPVTGPMRPTGEEEEEEGNAANGNGEANGGGLRKFAKLVEEVRKMAKVISMIAY